jgi:hypothetical protein
VFFSWENGSDFAKNGMFAGFWFLAMILKGFYDTNELVGLMKGHA